MENSFKHLDFFGGTGDRVLAERALVSDESHLSVIPPDSGSNAKSSKSQVPESKPLSLPPACGPHMGF